MDLGALEEYRGELEDCRFCPMCKVAGEVANVSYLESHGTRARAIMLWRALTDGAELSGREVELLYQCTLDTISQAWCLHHYRVGEYIRTAREAVFSAGGAPAVVKQAVIDDGAAAAGPPREAGGARLIGGEVAQTGREELLEAAARVLAQLSGAEGGRVVPWLASVGAPSYCLGDVEGARTAARRIAEHVARSRASRLIADGPQTLWMLKEVFPRLGVSLPEGVAISSIMEEVDGALAKGVRREAQRRGRVRAFVHESRATCMLADSLSDDRAILPEFTGPEEACGVGAVFEQSRRVLEATAGAERLLSPWSRSLCKSCGADDSLSRTYPAIAKMLARRRIEEARELGAELIATDSLLCAEQMRGAREHGDPQISWIPELILESGG